MGVCVPCLCRHLRERSPCRCLGVGKVVAKVSEIEGKLAALTIVGSADIGVGTLMRAELGLSISHEVRALAPQIAKLIQHQVALLVAKVDRFSIDLDEGHMSAAEHEEKMEARGASIETVLK